MHFCLKEVSNELWGIAQEGWLSGQVTKGFPWAIHHSSEAGLQCFRLWNLIGLLMWWDWICLSGVDSRVTKLTEAKVHKPECRAIDLQWPECSGRPDQHIFTLLERLMESLLAKQKIMLLSCLAKICTCRTLLWQTLPAFPSEFIYPGLHIWWILL